MADRSIEDGRMKGPNYFRPDIAGVLGAAGVLEEAVQDNAPS